MHFYSVLTLQLNYWHINLLTLVKRFAMFDDDYLDDEWDSMDELLRRYEEIKNGEARHLETVSPHLTIFPLRRVTSFQLSFLSGNHRAIHLSCIGTNRAVVLHALDDRLGRSAFLELQDQPLLVKAGKVK